MPVSNDGVSSNTQVVPSTQVNSYQFIEFNTRNMACKSTHIQSSIWQ